MDHTIDVLVTGSDVPPFRASTVLVSDGTTHLLVDPGASPSAPAVLDGLARRGLAREDVHVVVATHLHYDHSENAALFEHAEVVAGEGELAALRAVLDEVSAATGLGRDELVLGGPREDEVLDAVGDVLKRTYEVGNGLYLNRIAKGLVKQLAFWGPRAEGAASRLTRITSEHELGRGIRVLPTPGHTPGHVSVLVETTSGGACLVAGDAIPTGRWMGRDDASLPFCVDVPRFLATKRALERVAPWVIPGHGAMFRVDEQGGAA